MTHNPFAPSKPVKPAVTRLKKEDIDTIGRATARFVSEVVDPLEKRIEQLEADLRYAREEAERALETDLTRHLGEDDDPPKTLEQLNEMAARHKEAS